MAFSDKSPQRFDCGATFDFGSGERRFSVQKGTQVSRNGRCCR